jgi:uncharacterized protein
VVWSFETAVVLCLIGVAVGAFGTVIGAGGGFILTPILLLLYPHDSPQTLTAISLAAVFFNAASGSVAYARQRRIDIRSGTVFALATLPGAIGGALVVGDVSRHAFDGIMGSVLALLAGWLLAGERWPLPPAKRHLERRELVDRAGERYVYSVSLRRGALYSLGVGFISSFLGIGAHRHGVRRTLALSVGVVFGAQLGAHVSVRVRGPAIQRLLAVALLAVAARLLLAV